MKVLFKCEPYEMPRKTAPTLYRASVLDFFYMDRCVLYFFFFGLKWWMWTAFHLGPPACCRYITWWLLKVPTYPCRCPWLEWDMTSDFIDCIWCFMCTVLRRKYLWCVPIVSSGGCFMWFLPTPRPVLWICGSFITAPFTRILRFNSNNCQLSKH